MNTLLPAADPAPLDARRDRPWAAATAAETVLSAWMVLTAIQDELEDLAASRDPAESRMGVEGLAATIAAAEVARRLAYALVGSEDRGAIVVQADDAGRLLVHLDDDDFPCVIL